MLKLIKSNKEKKMNQLEKEISLIKDIEKFKKFLISCLVIFSVLSCYQVTKLTSEQYIPALIMLSLIVLILMFVMRKIYKIHIFKNII